MRDLLTLLIDDDPDDQDLFSMVVKEEYPQVDCRFADDGVDALEKFNAPTPLIPDLVFLDINMPRMNGLECLKRIKKLPHLLHTPVYMYSTSAEPSIVKECYNLGVAGFIKKEADIELLQKRLLEVLAQYIRAY